MQLRIVFLGTSHFAIPALSSLLEHDFCIVGVFTQPDKPNARGKKVFHSPVKEFSLKHSLPLFQPPSIKSQESIKQIQTLQPDLIIVVSYGQILSEELICIPRYKTINIHGSLLPKYRGASPINASLLHGDSTTGITIMLMDKLLDHGPILSQKEIPIMPEDDYISLSATLADTGAQLLIDTISLYVNGELEPKEQDHKKATFTSLLKKEDGEIDWNKSAYENVQQIKAYMLFPTSYTFLNDKRVKITKAHVQYQTHQEIPGTVFIENKTLGVYCKNDILIIETLQMQGKKEMNSFQFLQGYQLADKKFGK